MTEDPSLSVPDAPWWHEPWPPPGARLDVRRDGAEYTDHVVVDEAHRQEVAEPVPPGRGYARWKLGQFVHEYGDLQERGIHDVRRSEGGPDGRGICSCGLYLPAGAREVDVRGHRAMPGFDRLDWVLVVPSSRRVDERRYDVTCQRCGGQESRLDWVDARDARAEHEQRCCPPVAWPRRP